MHADFEKYLPRPGQRRILPSLYGSSDSLVLTLAAAALKKQGRMLVVLAARASDARRILEEIPWFHDDAENPLRCHLLPDWETLPYDTFSPHQDLVSQRLSTLYEVQNARCDILIVPASTALQRIAPPSFLAGHSFFFNQGEILDENRLRAQLTLAGYNPVSQVLSHGEYAVRGGLIDLYPMGAPLPYRLDLFGDTIESIRTFDVDSQRSLYPVREIRILPGREFPMDENARAFFRSRWRETFEGDPTLSVIYRDIASGIASAGIEYYLPLFFQETATLFHYLPDDAVFALVGDIGDAIERFWRETSSRHAFLRADRERPLLPPERIFLKEEDFFTFLKPYGRWVLRADDSPSELSAPIPDIAITRRADNPIGSLQAWLGTHTKRTLICAESPGRRETMQQLFGEYSLEVAACRGYADFMTSTSPLMFTVSPVHRGFSLGYVLGDISIVTETELYANVGRRSARRRQESVTQIEHMVRDIAELKVGDPVVHVNHGIGRYRGLAPLEAAQDETEFLHLQYANNTALHVPVSHLHLISRYAGASSEDAPLHTLGSGQWEKARQQAEKKVLDTAAELLDLYAKRALRKGHAFSLTMRDYEAFADSFGFEETPDQSIAIQAVIADMTSEQPMDRLICGDVGFGKTEVALRAAFIAVMGGKQVALLAPTTLLAEQHALTFADRFADWPVRIAELSRFRTPKQIAQTIRALDEGTVDIVIGTHKLLSREVRFARLGLVVIDEEHRFGVRQKEALKALRTNVDVLTLTATPIPRTLGMALEGLRNFSTIATAPQKRLAIKTFVRTEDASVIREACQRELKRGGQIYFLHNEVETIENRRAMLTDLLPEARIGVAHGQMNERELEKVMRDFVAQRYNILLCTTIIETGIDVPNANTMLMHRADKFGLAQLHQLRGRIGRSHHQAYAYLLVYDTLTLSRQAQRRLEAIRQMEDLGSGFFLAMHDLEIRGAGEILGEEQSGEIQEIGFQLYSDMLREAVSALKKGEKPDFDAPFSTTTEINLHTPALLPATYCAGV
ncbi:MAG: transcription-repair coupling factor, partial [Burkholderiaceae bacterium]|nr:transcription-repair coupling factor [Burkholderiaceae bacterium]